MSDNSPDNNTSYTAMISQLSKTLASANRFILNNLADNDLSDIVPSHGDILVKLLSEGTSNMASIAESIGKDPSTVTALVKKLKDAGYVETGKNALDKRIVEVKLTDRGKKLKDPIEAISKKLVNVMEESSSKADLENTFTTLQDIKTAFDEADIIGKRTL